MWLNERVRLEKVYINKFRNLKGSKYESIILQNQEIRQREFRNIVSREINRTQRESIKFCYQKAEDSELYQMRNCSKYMVLLVELLKTIDDTINQISAIRQSRSRSHWNKYRRRGEKDNLGQEIMCSELVCDLESVKLNKEDVVVKEY